MAAVDFQKVGKQFGKSVPVLADLDLHVTDGEFMVLVGPSGCGKTTTLRLLAGLDAPSSGNIRIGGRDVTDLAAAERDVAMVFQSYALYPQMTVAENMGFALRVARRPSAEIRSAVLKAARTLQLEPLLDRRPRELSGGQRQRVAIGRAIVRAPAVFLFDEPLSNLDASLRTQTRVELARLHERLGATMLYVTHDQVEAMTLGQRIAIFNRGRIEQVGPPLELYRRPVNRFVAGFLGSPAINVLPAIASAVGADWRHELAGGGALLGRALSSALSMRVAAVGIRPEHFFLVALDEDYGVSGRVEVLEHLGDFCIAHITLPGTSGPMAVKLPAATGNRLRRGEAVRLGCAPEDLIPFDAAGRNLAAAEPRVA